MEPMWLPDGGSPDVPSNEDLAQRANQPRNAVSGDEVGVLEPVCKSGGFAETYICNNREFIPNFGERRRQGETISTAFVESTINQVVSRRFVKKQQVQWTLRGAH